MVNDTNSLTDTNPKTTKIIIQGIVASCFAEKRVSLYVFCENMFVYLSRKEKSTPIIMHDNSIAEKGF